VEASWHLAKFMGSDEGELIWTQTTFSLPVRVNVLNSPFWQEQARNPKMKVFLDLLPLAHWRPVMPAGQILSDGLVSAVDQVRKGQRAPKQALDDLTQRVNAELTRVGA
jgi:ABC-type glycerol-3-phosphate transport system substrate-binding protein